ncbi:hypothetical protein [Leucobacter sp. NPDC077196]|uniref:hypothetical protein n=1 Tax=Leucobacter sp. NPDC077196 TaxID=3154959 RepID=UPI0034170CA4
MYIRQPRQVPGDDFTNIAWAQLTDSHRLLMVALRMLADVGGAERVDLHRIRRETWQAGEEGASWPTIDAVETMLLELADAGWLRFYPDPKGSGTELYQVLAPWPKPQKQGFPKWDPPADSPPPVPVEIPMDEPFRKPVVGGVRAGAGERAGASAGAGEREGSSGTTEIPQLRITPSRFCTEHPGGPPQDLDCRNCGTARLRQEEHKEARVARVQADRLPLALRGPVIAQLDAKIQALEEAAAQALLPAPDIDEPEEFITEDGLIDHT